jgi:chromosome segregation ATPase
MTLPLSAQDKQADLATELQKIRMFRQETVESVKKVRAQIREISSASVIAEFHGSLLKAELEQLKPEILGIKAATARYDAEIAKLAPNSKELQEKLTAERERAEAAMASTQQRIKSVLDKLSTLEAQRQTVRDLEIELMKWEKMLMLIDEREIELRFEIAGVKLPVKK